MPNFNLKLYNFEKEGKGVEADERKPFVLLHVFILYFRNFGKMVLYNLSLFVSLVPITAVFCAMFVISLGENGVEALIQSENFQSWNQSFPWLMIFVNIYHFFISSSLTTSLGLILLSLSILLFGPLSAGFFYTSRNITREEHVFISDIFSQAWSNRKQAVPMGILDLLLALAIVLYFTNNYGGMNEGHLQVVGMIRYIALFLYCFYLVARGYIYTIMVTFDMPLTTCIKNGMTLAYTHLPRFFLALLATIIVIAINILLPLPSLLLLPFMDFSLVLFIIGFVAYRPVERYMIAPTLEDIKKSKKNS